MNKDDSTAQREIEELLGGHMGLNANSLGAATLAQSISQAMGALGCTDLAAFLQDLRTSEDALNALVEAVVVPETSFFRSPESFTYLRDYLVSATQAQTYPKVWRALSLPCSTGEEPYSIAITFLEAGIPGNQFQVDGVDISAAALAKAERGLYQSYSFRRNATQAADAYIQQYFQVVQDTYHLAPTVKSQVQFYQDNLAYGGCLADQSPYDIIFCRNLLIYLHQDARDRALQNLYRLLAPNGLLFVGYAETHQIDRQRFTPIRAPKAFVYCKQDKPVQALISRAHQHSSDPVKTVKNVAEPRPNLNFKKEIKADVTASSIAPSKPTNGSKSKISNGGSAHSSQPISSSSNSASSSRSSDTIDNPENIFPSLSSAIDGCVDQATDQYRDKELISIWLLADEGQLITATEQCHRYLKAHPTSAAAYLLLGELYQAQGDDQQAEVAFRKTLYLNPTCVEALIHWALISEQKGDQATVEQLRRRLARIVNETFI